MFYELYLKAQAYVRGKHMTRKAWMDKVGNTVLGQTDSVEIHPNDSFREKGRVSKYLIKNSPGQFFIFWRLFRWNQ